MNYNMHSKSITMQNYCNDFALNNNVKIFNTNLDSKIFFNNKNIESKARKSRYENLKNICLKNNIKYVLTAHHENDQIETIYMCEKNNSSWVSKLGIREKFNLFKNDKDTIDVLRPMLSVNKKNIIEYAKKNKLIFYDDPTNKNIRFLRNKIRLEIKSKIDQVSFRNFYLKISKINKKKLNLISNKIKEKTNQLLFFSFKNNFVVLNKEELSFQDNDFLILFIKKILNEELMFDYKTSKSSWKNLIKFFFKERKGSEFILGENSNIGICTSNNYVYLYKKNNDAIKNISSIGNYQFRLGSISVSESLSFMRFKNKNSICVPFKYLKNLEVKNWKYGDKCIKPDNSMIKVSDIFINNKLSFFNKKFCPLIKYNDDIIWIPKLFHGKLKNIKSNDKFIILKWNSII